MTDATEPVRQVRISDADRESAAQLLQQALTEGRISIAELDERIRQVYQARFAEDLESPFVDLPTSPVTALPPCADGAADAGPGSPVITDPNELVAMSTGLGTLKRDGRWVVPARLAIEVDAGAIVLDCTRAQIVHPVVHLEVQVRSGTFKLIVGLDMTADINRVSTRSGTARSKVDAVQTPRFPHFVLTGSVGSGSLLVRRPMFG